MEKFKEHSLHLGGRYVQLEENYVTSYLQPFNDKLALRSLRRMLSAYVIEKNGRTVESLRRISFDNRSCPYISVLTIVGRGEKYQTILIRRQEAIWKKLCRKSMVSIATKNVYAFLLPMVNILRCAVVV